MKKKLLIGLFCALALVSTGCVKEQKLKDGKEIVAKTKGKTITAEDLYKSLKDSYGASALVDMIDGFIANKEITDQSDAEVKAEDKIDELKKQYASSNWDLLLSSNGYSSEAELLKTYKDYYLKDELAKKWFQENITDEEIKEYYNNEMIGDITARHILITVDTTNSMTDEEKEEVKTKAYNKAASIIKKLDAGKKFEDLAKKYSDDEDTADNGGLLGEFNKQSSYDEAFVNAAVALEVEKYTTTPIETEEGYEIIYKVKEADKQKLSKVKETIRETLADKAVEADSNYFYTAWIAIRKEYNLSIKDTLVNEDYDKLVAKYSTSK